MPPAVSIVIPAYNEAATIETVLRAVRSAEVDKEILVVDDGSTDGTGDVLRRLQPQHPFQLITHPANFGKGRAIRSALARCQGHLVLLQDADLEYDPRDYPALLQPFTDPATMVVYGSRFLRNPQASWGLHRFANRLITAMVNACFGSALTDAETGYKVFRRAVADGLSLRANSFEFEVEFTCKVLRRGYRVVEVPVGYAYRSYKEGKKITWRDGVLALWLILWYRLTLAPARGADARGTRETRRCGTPARTTPDGGQCTAGAPSGPYGSRGS